MIKKLLLTIAAVLCSAALFAQSNWGGVKGTVVNRAGRAAVSQASIVLSQNGKEVAAAQADNEGRFLVEGLENGVYDMTVKANGYLDAHVNVTVEGYVKDLIFVGMVLDGVHSQFVGFIFCCKCGGAHGQDHGQCQENGY